MKGISTLVEAIAFFSDESRAHDFAVRMRWPHGPACPRNDCGNADPKRIQALPKRRKWRCKECGRDFTVKVGTIYEDSALPMSKWMPAVWLLASNRNGISSCELARALGVSQKSAWHMLHRIRAAFATPTHEQLSGEVEADETFFGPKARNKRGNVGLAQKTGKKALGPWANRTIVMGMVERGGRARAWVVPNTRRVTLMPRIREHIAPGSTVYTDASHSYHDVSKEYVHAVIDHAVKYVEGNVHTNSIENFWSVLKRTMAGTYIAARPWHLDAYLDEQIYRFNSRKEKDGDRFVSAVKAADGKRLTWRALVAKNPKRVSL
jgi:transposase-like protein